MPTGMALLTSIILCIRISLAVRQRTQIDPTPVYASSSPEEFKIGQEVYVKDDGTDWMSGKVTSTDPLMVQPQNWSTPHKWTVVEASKDEHALWQQIEDLEAQKKTAVAAEDYERAAELKKTKNRLGAEHAEELARANASAGMAADQMACVKAELAKNAKTNSKQETQLETTASDIQTMKGELVKKIHLLEAEVVDIQSTLTEQLTKNTQQIEKVQAEFESDLASRKASMSYITIGAGFCTDSSGRSPSNNFFQFAKYEKTCSSQCTSDTNCEAYAFWFGGWDKGFCRTYGRYISSAPSGGQFLKRYGGAVTSSNGTEPGRDVNTRVICKKKAYWHLPSRK